MIDARYISNYAIGGPLQYPRSPGFVLSPVLPRQQQPMYDNRVSYADLAGLGQGPSFGAIAFFGAALLGFGALVLALGRRRS